MSNAVIYKSIEGQVCVIHPVPDCGLTIEQIALKDVPAGQPFAIVDAAEIPSDRSMRDAWDVDEALLTDGVGADYGAGSDNAVIEWNADGTPVIKQGGTQ
jgi:hypothetical protein